MRSALVNRRLLDDQAGPSVRNHSTLHAKRQRDGRPGGMTGWEADHDRTREIAESFAGVQVVDAGPLPGAEIRVAWSLETDAVQVTVCDGGSETSPELGHPTQAATGGRGLRIVEQLSTGWGTSRDDKGTTVWARVPVARATTEMTTVGGPAVATESG